MKILTKGGSRTCMCLTSFHSMIFESTEKNLVLFIALFFFTAIALLYMVALPNRACEPVDHSDAPACRMIS